MKKQTKLVAVTSAAALLAIGASMTSFAATGWVEEDGTWYFYDNDGNKVTDEWKKSGDNWYWLDGEEDGAMAMDKMIEDDDDYFYVDSTGVMVTNTWVKVVNEDQDDDDDPAEYHFYYMQSNGKAYRQKGDSLNKKTIDGKQYAFDEEGIMLYGWVDENGEMQNDDTGWATTNELYYFGGWEDGSMKTGWQKITVYDDTNDKDDDYDYWFNFKSNGKRRGETNKKKINGKYYAFNEFGVMVYEWYQTTDANAQAASNWNYFSSPEDGARVYKGWFKVAPPTEDNTFVEQDNLTFASKDSDDESDRWYYADDEGLVAGQIKKIKGKYYGFWPEDGDKSARMLTGLCALKMNGEKIVDVIADDMDSDDLDNFMDSTYAKESTATSGVYMYYFGDNADTDGAMKTGNVTVNLDGDNYTFSFSKSGGAESRGRGLNGIDDGDYIYRYGQRIKADSDEKYILVYASDDTGSDSAVVIDYDGSDVRKLALDYVTLVSDTTTNKDGDTVRYIHGINGKANHLYLVNTAGKVQDGSMTAKKDGDDWYWYATKAEGIKMYTNNKNLNSGNGYTCVLDNHAWEADTWN